MPITFAAKSFQKKSEQKNTVRLLIDRLKGFERERSHKIVHVSDLTKDHEFCPRQFALYDTLNLRPKDRHVSAALRVAFDQGNSLHDMFREKWLEHDVVGHWRCVNCSKQVQFCKKPQKPCAFCGCRVWKYVEVSFEAFGTSGSIDLMIDFGTGKHSLIEAKTEDKDSFKKLIAPYAEHRLRSILYLHAIANSDSPYKNRIDTSEVRVVYISKAFGAKNLDFGAVIPFKEFVVKADHEKAASYFKSPMILKKWREGKGAFPEGICDNPFCKRAQSCNVSKHCFSGEY